MLSLKTNYKDFGLKYRDFHHIISTISNYIEVDAALIFGSRAKNNYKKGSDIDLGLKGSRLNAKIISNISIKLNEHLPIPFIVDVIDYTHLKK